jgi:hypothetical protein
VKAGTKPDNFTLKSKTGSTVQYVMSDTVKLTDTKEAALQTIGVDIFEGEDPEDEDSPPKWVHTSEVTLDFEKISKNKKAVEALTAFLGVLTKENLYTEAVDFKKSLNGSFFTQLLKVIENVEGKDKAAKLVTLIGAFKPTQSPKNAKSTLSQEKCLKKFLNSKSGKNKK